MYAKVEEVEGGFAPILKIKNVGRVDLGVYSTARKAAVAHDVARLICLHEKRPETDLRMDTGLMHQTEGYLCDPFFKQLLDSNTPFESVCELLRSGALVDNFLCAQDRQTRSNTSGDRLSPSARRQPPAPQQHMPPQRSGSGLTAPRPAGHAAGEPPATTQQEAAPAKQAHQQPQQLSHKSSAQTHQAMPPHSPFQGAGGGLAARRPSASASPTQDTAGAADEAAGRPSPAKKRAVRWLEWPTKGGGQYVTAISERALKLNMTLPVKMKRELFQITASPARVDAYDLVPGSAQRWTWEVRDYVKDERRVTSIHSLGNFFKHYGAVAGDVMVVVASAPGAVKASVWKADSKEAAEFKAFQDRQADKAAEKQGRAAAAGAGRKRAADGPPSDKPAAKAAKAADRPAQGQASALAPEGSRPMSKTASGPQKLQRQGLAEQPASGQHQRQQQQGGTAPSPPARPQQKGAALVAGTDKAPPRVAAPHARSDGLLALAESGVNPSHPSAEETQALSPTGQMAQSPFRHRPLQPGLSTAVPIKQEQQERGSPLPAVQPGMELDQQAAAAQGGAPNGSGAAAGPAAPGGGAGDATHSPARMSCADASQLLGGAGAGAAPAGGAHLAQQRLQLQQQQALSQPAASGAGAVGLQVQAAELPDPLVLAGDEAGVYVAMGRLLGMVASTGHVPAEAVAAYRRSFMRLDPHGKRWFAYDSLKQLVDAGEWADVHEWLLCK
ncbi:hypothetical protein ABPG75_009669 [Micractinium tetrahymenae]